MTGREDDDRLVARLRAAGCVFAEEEAAALRRWAADVRQLEVWVARREAGEPLEHIVGHVEFAGLDLAVGRGVFVPRQRSLLLAETAVDLLAGRRTPRFVEGFCGVAPIATVVARRRPDARVLAIDADPAAVALAEINLHPHPVYCGTGLAGLPPALRGRVDVVAAVPPYVPESEVLTMPHEARDHEPREALIGGGRDGLNQVMSQLREAADWLTVGGAVAVEMNVRQVSAAADAARSAALAPRVVTGADGQTAVLVGVR